MVKQIKCHFQQREQIALHIKGIEYNISLTHF